MLISEVKTFFYMQIEGAYIRNMPFLNFMHVLDEVNYIRMSFKRASVLKNSREFPYFTGSTDSGMSRHASKHMFRTTFHLEQGIISRV